MYDVADTAAPNSQPTMLDKALALAELGYPVFPLQVLGKTPINKNFPSIASSDPEDIRALWTDAVGEPQNFNIGIATGKGFIAVDYDTKKGKEGFAWRDKFDSEGMPESVRMITPNGGEHLILRTPSNLIIGSSVEKIGSGVDTRGRNSYIVAPGSVILTDNGERRTYKFKTGKRALDQAEPSPEFFTQLLLQHSRYNDSPKETMPLVDLDAPENVKRAIQYLQNEAPHAIEGNSGDQTTFAVAARLHDFGISQDFAFDIMLEFWNDAKASPPWAPQELKRKVENAYLYAQNPHGVLSPQAEFYPIEVDEAMRPGHLLASVPDDPDWPRPHVVTSFDPAEIPERDFLFNGLFATRTVSAIVAPSGAGKTQWLIQAALSIATGRPLNALAPTKVRKVWLWNQEDDTDELKRRLYAAMLAFDIEFKEFDKRLFFDSGVDRRLTIAGKNPQNNLMATKHVQRIIDRIKQNSIEVFIADPLVEFHQGEENDNVQMAYVASLLRRIAVEGNCAVLIGHHDRKPDSASSNGHVGNQNAMRGASSLQGVTRAIATLYTMSQADARELRIDEDTRHRYLRFDSAKNNHGISGGKPVWFERYGQAMRFEGEEVGVLRPVDLVGSRMERVQDEGASPEEVERRRLVAQAVRALGEAAALTGGRKDGWFKWADVLDRMMVSGEGGGHSPVTWRRWMSALDGERFTSPVCRGVVTVRRVGARSTFLSYTPPENDLKTLFS